MAMAALCSLSAGSYSGQTGHADRFGSLLCHRLIGKNIAVLQTWKQLQQRNCLRAIVNISGRQQKSHRPQVFSDNGMNFRVQASACFADAAWCLTFARFLIPRPACTDALIDVESMLRSAPVLEAAQSSKIFFRVPSSRQRQKQLYTVWCGPNLAGRSLQRAPLRASHRMPLRCARISFCRRPVCEIGISGWTSSHSLSVSS